MNATRMYNIFYHQFQQFIMDNLLMYVSGNVLLVIICSTIILAIILFLFYLRWIVKSYVLNRKGTISSMSSSNSSSTERLTHLQNSSIETDCETETKFIIMPQQPESGWKCSYENEKEGYNFYRLPSDKRKRGISYYKFNSVDDEFEDTNGFTECYENRNSRPVTYFGRRGRSLHRKRTWEKAGVRIFQNNMIYDEYKGKDKGTDQVIPTINIMSPNNVPNYTTNCLFIGVQIYCQTNGARNKEVLI